jgi:hypothetical protein
MQHYIYGLFDPRDDQIRYVGRTSNLKHRYRTHRYTGSKGNTKSDWVSELKDLGLLPVMKGLAKVSGEDVEEKEKYYINYYLKQGANLTNTLLYKSHKSDPDKTTSIVRNDVERSQLYAKSLEDARTIGELTQKTRHLDTLEIEVSGLRKRVERLIQYRVLFWVLLVLFVVAVVIFSVLLYVNT